MNLDTNNAEVGSVCAATEKLTDYCLKRILRAFSLIQGYNVDSPDFPNSICFGCHLELSKKDKSDEYSLKIIVNDYDPKRVKILRSDTKCECRICEVAKMPGIKYQRMMKTKRGRPKKKMQLLFLSHIKYALTALRIFIGAAFTQKNQL